MRSRLLFAVLLMLAAPAFAAPVLAEDAPAADPQAAPAQKFVQDLGDHAVAIVSNKNIPVAQRNEKYRAMLRDSFDLPVIAHFVIGRNWNAATPEQQQEYMKLFEALVVKTYGDRLDLYAGEDFKVTGARPESDEDEMVASEITHADNSTPTKVDWRVRHKNGKTAVIDVVVEGVSQSVTQRQEYASILQRNNGDINALLDAMRQSLQQPAQTAQNQ